MVTDAERGGPTDCDSALLPLLVLVLVGVLMWVVVGRLQLLLSLAACHSLRNTSSNNRQQVTLM